MHGRVLSLTVSGVGLTGFHDAYAVWLYTDQHTAQLLGLSLIARAVPEP